MTWLCFVWLQRRQRILKASEGCGLFKIDHTIMESQENTKVDIPRSVGVASMEKMGANTMVEGR